MHWSQDCENLNPTSWRLWKRRPAWTNQNWL